MDLGMLGWNVTFREHAAAWRDRHDSHAVPARVASVHKQGYLVYTSGGELTATVTGRFHRTARSPRDYPAIGDWVLVDPDPGRGTAVIRHVLPRATAFVRKAPISGGRGLGTVGGRERIVGGATEEQVVAANIDTVLCVTALDDDFGPRRIERYLLLGLSSGAEPVIVLNKADRARDIDAKLEEVRERARGAPVHAVSALAGTGLDSLSPYLAPGRTVALVGSSGVGKSTLINRLLGTDRLAVGAVRERDGKGRHTTTWRELIRVPHGGMLVDTPGMREVQLWVDEATVNAFFRDIVSLADECRFGDCRHTTEPGCAIAEALASDRLDGDRYEDFLRLRAEVDYLDERKRGKRERSGHGARRVDGR